MANKISHNKRIIFKTRGSSRGKELCHPTRTKVK